MPQQRIKNASFEAISGLDIFTKNIKGSSVEFCTGKALDLSNLITFLSSTGIIELMFVFSSGGIVITGRNEEKGISVSIDIPKKNVEKYLFRQREPFSVGVRTLSLVPVVPSFVGDTMIMFFMLENDDHTMTFVSVSLDKDTRNEMTYDEISTLDIDADTFDMEEKGPRGVKAVVEISSSCLLTNYMKHKTKLSDLIVERDLIAIESETEDTHKRTEIRRATKRSDIKYIKRHVAEKDDVVFQTDTKVMVKLLKGLKALKLEESLLLKFGDAPALSIECEIGTLALVRISFDQKK